MLSFLYSFGFVLDPILERKKITDESLKIMVPVMDLIKIGDSSIFSSFASHGEKAISLLPPKAIGTWSHLFSNLKNKTKQTNKKKQLCPFFFFILVYILPCLVCRNKTVQVHLEVSVSKMLMFTSGFSSFGVGIFIITIIYSNLLLLLFI